MHGGIGMSKTASEVTGLIVDPDVVTVNRVIAMDEDLTKSDLSEEIKQDIAAFRALKPYLGHCLSLNHDLNNPLAGILGYAEFILTDNPNLDEDLRNNIEQIVTCAERIRDRIEKLCAHKIELVEDVDLENVVRAYEAYAKPLP